MEEDISKLYPTLRVKIHQSPPLSHAREDVKDTWLDTVAEGEWDLRVWRTRRLSLFGEEELYYRKGLVWNMSHNGRYLIQEKPVQHEVLRMIRRAVDVTDKGFDSFRGPEYMQIGQFEYRYEQEGTTSLFRGVEQIFHKKHLAAKVYVIGGLVV